MAKDATGAAEQNTTSARTKSPTSMESSTNGSDKFTKRKLHVLNRVQKVPVPTKRGTEKRRCWSKGQGRFTTMEAKSQGNCGGARGDCCTTGQRNLTRCDSSKGDDKQRKTKSSRDSETDKRRRIECLVTARRRSWRQATRTWQRNFRSESRDCSNKRRTSRR